MEYHKLGCRAVLWITSWVTRSTKRAESSYVWCGMVAEEEETQTVPLHFRSSWTSKTLETWAELNATLVMFLSGLFSPIQHILLLFSFPQEGPLCLPHPLCLLVLKKSLNPDLSHHLLSFCPPFLTTALLYSSFPQSCHI